MYNVACVMLRAICLCRTTVFGAMNARNLRGAFDRHKSVSENVSLSGPLLSRFDIVLVLLDERDSAWDDAISSHIISSHQAAAGLATAQQVHGDCCCTRTLASLPFIVHGRNAVHGA